MNKQREAKGLGGFFNDSQFQNDFLDLIDMIDTQNKKEKVHPMQQPPPKMLKKPIDPKVKEQKK